MSRSKPEDVPVGVRRAADYFRAMAEERARRAKPRTPRCEDCLDHGLLYYPHVHERRTYWYVFRCVCGAPDDYGPHKAPSGDVVYGPRPWGSGIPLWADYRRKDGRPLKREDVYNVAERESADQCLFEAGVD